MITRRHLLTGLGAGALGLLSAPAQAAETPAQRGPRARYFPNALLRTHEGREVRFYDDLIRGKTVVINMMYAECEGVCPTMTENLKQVHKLLGERVGRDIFMYSITLTPEQDTPERLKHYVEMHGIKPGWLFLTGQRDDITLIRRRLGFYELDPKLDADKTQHGLIRIGNETVDRWCMTPALSLPLQIVEAIRTIV